VVPKRERWEFHYMYLFCFLILEGVVEGELVGRCCDVSLYPRPIIVSRVLTLLLRSLPPQHVCLSSTRP
jgi:hypothetical protein